jgi:hypothetical protein
MYMSSQASVARSLNSNKSSKRTPLASLKLNYSNIHLSHITVDPDQVAKASRETLLDDKDE